VVAGASGGIGQALCAALIARGAPLVALSRRRPEGWRDEPDRRFIPTDILDEASLAAAAARVGDWGAAWGPPRLIIAATGVLHSPTLTPEKTYRALTAAALVEVFVVNAIGPALLAKHFLPLTPRGQRSVFAALSARVGSIGDNRLGGWHGYRASKAALNQILRGLAIEHARARPDGIVVALHPGTVATGLSAPFSGGASAKVFTPAVAAAHLLSVIDGLTPADSGGFFAWDGSPIPW
jgi:NAD(P)-dependent dehydrogenase (short-subunit alcohol dehydrogenase family)